HEHALAAARPVANHPDRAAAAQRVHAGQWFVQDEEFRIVRERLRELHALTHAFAVGADALGGDIEQVDGRERAFGRRARGPIVEPVEPYERRDPFEARHALVEGILFGTETDPEVAIRAPPDFFAEHAHAALARSQLAGNKLHERALAGAVGSEQSGDAWRH